MAYGGQTAEGEEEARASKGGRVRFVYDIQDYRTMYDVMDELRDDLCYSIERAKEEGSRAIPDMIWVVNREKGECFYVDASEKHLHVIMQPHDRIRGGLFVFDNEAFYWINRENCIGKPEPWQASATLERIEWKHFDKWLKKIAVEDRAAGILTIVEVSFAPTFRRKENWEHMRAFFMGFPQHEGGIELCTDRNTYEELSRRIKPPASPTIPPAAEATNE